MTTECESQALLTAVRLHVCEFLKRLVRCHKNSSHDDATKSRRHYSFQLLEVEETCEGDQSNCTTSVDKLLNEIQQFLQVQTSVDKALELVPEMGQVLGRLCAIPVITGDPALYRKLMACLSALHRPHPTTAMEISARKWALNQLRNTVTCSAYKTWPYHHLYSTTQILQKRKLKQNVSAIVRLVEGPACAGGCTGRKDTVPGRCQGCQAGKDKDSAEHLRRVKQVAQVLLMPCQPPSEFWPAWDAILQYLALQPMDPDIENIYIALSDQVEELPYSTRLLLWRSYLPALEAAVLAAVDTASHSAVLPSVIRDALHRSLLPRACAEDGSLYRVVCSMLHALLSSSSGSSLVADIMTEFSHCVHGNIQAAASNHQVLLVALPVPGSRLQSLAVLLRTLPTDFSSQGAEQHLMRICDGVRDLREDGGSDGCHGDRLLLLLLHHQAWCQHALWLMLASTDHAKRETLASFVFSHFKEKNIIDLKSSYLAVLGRLQSLAGTDVTPAALESCLLQRKATTIQASPATEGQLVVEGHPALRQTLLVLLLRSPAPSHIASPILSWTTSSSDCHQHLAALAHAHQAFPLARECWSVAARSDHRRVLQALVVEVEGRGEQDSPQRLPETQQLLQESEKLLQQLASSGS